ncbi:MAG: hypothetical protein RL757_1125 [Bacteroidota bacterium]|jgi:hypothetical protein
MDFQLLLKTHFFMLQRVQLLINNHLCYLCTFSI